MRPTITEQLDGVARLLDAVGTDEGLSAASREMLRDAGRLVHRVRGSWSATLPFLTDDNATLGALLTDLGVTVPDGPADPIDVHGAAEHNAALRARLAATIRGLPRTGDGAAARARIHAYLRHRVDTDPT